MFVLYTYVHNDIKGETFLFSIMIDILLYMRYTIRHSSSFLLLTLFLFPYSFFFFTFFNIIFLFSSLILFFSGSVDLRTSKFQIWCVLYMRLKACFKVQNLSLLISFRVTLLVISVRRSWLYVIQLAIAYNCFCNLVEMRALHLWHFTSLHSYIY